jgi:Zn ribbon nucleic-acid-binding protein
MRRYGTISVVWLHICPVCDGELSLGLWSFYIHAVSLVTCVRDGHLLLNPYPANVENRVSSLNTSRWQMGFNPYPTAFPYGNGMVLHFYQQQESSTTKTVHKVINRGLKAYV